MEEPLSTHLLLLGPESIAVGRARAESFARSIDSQIVVHVRALGATEATAELRDLVGGEPLGVIADDESECLDAIARGADDVCTAQELTVRGFATFFDRLQLRARVRADRDQRAEALARNEKLTALGTLVAGIGHEINNPLTAISLSIQSAERIVGPVFALAHEIEALAESDRPADAVTLRRWRASLRLGRRQREALSLLDDIGRATEHIAGIVADLRVFSRTDANERPNVVDLKDAVDHAVRLVGREVELVCGLEYDFEAELPKVLVPANRLVQVISNLLVNAAHAVRDTPREHHRVRIGIRVDDDFVALSVTDTGPGVPAESIERIFDPFFTTKRQNLGTGLGLSISRSILRDMGGDLLVDSVFGEGATFICLIPRPSMPLPSLYQRDTQRHDASRPKRDATVLVVDEDERVLRAASRVLAPSYRVCLARDAEEALELIRSGTNASAIVAAVEPWDSGAAQIWEALQRDGNPLAERMVFTRARHDHAAPVDVDVESDERSISTSTIHDRLFLEKPLRSDALLDAVERALGDANEDDEARTQGSER